MNSVLWFPILLVAVFAAAIDIWQRRVPNWLSLPSIGLGIAVNILVSGWSGFSHSLGGIAVAVAALGALCWLGTMGMGDLKLCMAAGAWIGPSPMMFALLITAMAGGLIAIAY